MCVWGVGLGGLGGERGRGEQSLPTREICLPFGFRTQLGKDPFGLFLAPLSGEA